VNLVALFQLGRFYELMFGTRRFLLIYFASGLIASLASAWWNQGPSVGASGAIFGILGAMIFSIRRSPRWRNDPFGRSIVTQGVFLILANLVITWTVPQIDKAGHIGGLVAGLLLGALLPQRPEPPRPPAQVVIDVQPHDV
jgi:rhomboid protease GluP